MEVEGALLDESLLQSFRKHHKDLTTFQVGTVENSVDRGRQRVFVRLVLALIIEVVDGIAVGEHDGVVVPLATEDVDQQAVAGATGHTLVTVVGTHHLADITFLNQGLEGWQIGLPQVAHRHRGVIGVAQRLWTTVYGIVFGTGVGLEILIVVALHAEHSLNT